MKTCVKCKEPRPEAAFYREKNTCKDCFMKYWRAKMGLRDPVSTPCRICGVAVKNPILHTRRHHPTEQLVTDWQVTEEALVLNQRILGQRSDEDKRWTWGKARELLYFIQAGAVGRPIKVGITKNLPYRLSHLQAASPDPIEVLFTCDGGRVKELAIHEQLREYRTHGEWFRAELPVLELVVAMAHQDKA